MYLLDTNVLAELRKAKSARADQHVINWASQVVPISLFVSVITILEIETGILLIERKDKEQARILRVWLEVHVLPAFAKRTLDIDTNIARCCAKLHIPDKRPDRDALIAATAISHDLTLVTRNTKDFDLPDIKLLNPWEFDK